MTEPDQPRPLSPDELGFERIVYEKAPPRATVTLNRPEVLNAFDFRMLRELARAFEDASWDDEIRVVVVTGTGRAFCVGADLRAWGEDLLGNSKEYWKWFGAFMDMHNRLREIGKPTLARVNGIAVGGGNELQMACDLAVMVDDAFIRHVGLEHGSVPAGGATQWLPIMIGDRRAREMILLCDEVPAAQAAEWGLVNWAVPAAELDAKVDELVEKLASKLPETTRYAKQQLNWWRDISWHETVGHARDWLALSMHGDEAQDAIKRFLDRKRLGSPHERGADVARGCGPHDHPEPARGLQRVQRRPARGAAGGAGGGCRPGDPGGRDHGRGPRLLRRAGPEGVPGGRRARSASGSRRPTTRTSA